MTSYPLSLQPLSLHFPADLTVPKCIREKKTGKVQLWFGITVTARPDGRVICLILNPFYFPCMSTHYLFFTEFKEVTLKLLGQIIWDLDTAFIQNLLRKNRGVNTKEEKDHGP